MNNIILLKTYLIGVPFSLVFFCFLFIHILRPARNDKADHFSIAGFAFLSCIVWPAMLIITLTSFIVKFFIKLIYP